MNQHLTALQTFNPKFEPRTAQLELMNGIDTLLKTDQQNGLLVEAPTGTGKSLGSLIPLLQNNVSRIFYVTPNVLLINELMSHDIPALRERLFPDLSAVGLIGKDRFFCPNKTSDEFSHQKQLREDFLTGEWNGVRDTYRGSLTISDEFWKEVKYTTSSCKKENCPYFEQCTYMKMRKEAATSQVLVTTYSMLFSLLESDSDILGDLSDCCIVFDEAHQLPELIKNTLHRSFALSRICKKFETDKFLSWQEDVFETYPDYKEIFASINNNIDLLIDQIYDFEELLTLKLSEQVDDVYADSVSSISLLLDKQDEPKKMLSEIMTLLTELRDFFFELGEIFKEDNVQGSHSKIMDNCNYYHYLLEQAVGVYELARNADYLAVDWTSLESTEFGSYVTYESAPLNLLPFFEQFSTSKCIFMSGTLTTFGDFQLFKNEIGLDNDEFWSINEMVLTSPFALERQAELVVDESVGNPREPDYIVKLSERLPELVKDMKAGLILFNSHKQLREFEEEVRYNYELEGIFFKMQGSDSRENLVDSHKVDTDKGRISCLVGVSSFGVGLDLPKHYLDTVLIASLPFKAVNDPYLTAKLARIEAKRGNSFSQYTLPMASQTLTQYAGRLIRTSECKGSVIITDDRIVKAKYGGSLLTHLPNFGNKQRCIARNKALSGKQRRTRSARPTKMAVPDLPSMPMF